MSRIDDVTEQIRQLSTSEQKQLLHFLLQQTGGLEEDADEAWRNEIVQRVKAIHSGETALRPPHD